MRPDFGYFEEKQLGKTYDLRLLKKLFPYSRPYQKLLGLSILLVVAITLLDLSLPYVTKIAIDRFIVPQTTAPDRDTVHLDRRSINQNFAQKHDDRSLSQNADQIRRNRIQGLTIATVVYLIIVVANFILNFWQKLIMEYAGQMILHDLRTTLFAHIQKLSTTFFTRNPVGRLVTRATNDIQNMHELFTSIISLLFKDLILLVGITIVMLVLNWRLALASFCVLPFVILASFRFSRNARDVFRLLRVKIAEINSRFSETIGGINIIQLYNQEKANYQSFAALNHENYRVGMRQVHISAIFMPVIEMLGVVAVAIVIYAGGRGVLADSVSLGVLVAFISYIKMFFRPIRDLAEKYNILQNALASAERIFLILDENDFDDPVLETKISSLDQPDTTRLRPLPTTFESFAFENVSFAYVEDEPVLQNISFQVAAGQTLAIAGPTGSGKTTLLNLIIRFYEPNAGQLLLNATDLRQFAKSDYRSNIALVTQDPFLFSGTIRDNICQGNPEITNAELNQILEASNCQHIINRMPQGLTTHLSEGASNLSSGERQLLSIARAFVSNPQLILLDEATSYIDATTEHQIQQALANLMQNRTTIIVAHRLTTAKNADQIIVLNRGQIIEAGTHTRLLANRSFYFKLWQLMGA
ncbi:MAG: ABC transporter ATP-binding protein [Desulfobacterales bacterium]|nr:ABC transporter ATP-binding protein [Desulfobacterales bacterium]